MRLRHIKGAEQQIAQSPFVVNQPELVKGRWNEEIFHNENPIRMEVGMGKGKFLMELAQIHPEINFIGVERYSSVLLKAIQKMEELKLPNVRFLCEDAGELAEMFEEGEVDRLYLNFSDPWPKDRHAKRRLTSPGFMAVYDKILKADGAVEFKTDNQGLFAYSLEAIPEAGWKIDLYTYDLHSSPYADGNVMTEYRKKEKIKLLKYRRK